MFRDLQSRILHLPASTPSETTPLSADVYAIRGKTAWWIFDVGASDEAADFVNNLPCEISAAESRDGVARRLQRNVVISHFHRDHFFNLTHVNFDNLYVGRETYRHCDETIRALGLRDASRGSSQSSRRSVTVVELPCNLKTACGFELSPFLAAMPKDL